MRPHRALEGRDEGGRRPAREARRDAIHRGGPKGDSHARPRLARPRLPENRDGNRPRRYRQDPPEHQANEQGSHHGAFPLLSCIAARPGGRGVRSRVRPPAPAEQPEAGRQAHGPRAAGFRPATTGACRGPGSARAAWSPCRRHAHPRPVPAGTPRGFPQARSKSHASPPTRGLGVLRYLRTTLVSPEPSAWPRELGHTRRRGVPGVVLAAAARRGRHSCGAGPRTSHQRPCPRAPPVREGEARRPHCAPGARALVPVSRTLEGTPGSVRPGGRDTRPLGCGASRVPRGIDFALREL
jgi:hypothetical protein